MLFGERKEFAVEIALDEAHGGAWLFGRVCFWIDDAQVGDYQLGTSLRDLIPSMRRIVTDAGHRLINTAVSDDEAIDYIWRFSEGGFEDYDELGRQLGVDMPAKLLIVMGVDVFDSWVICLFDRTNYSKIASWKLNCSSDRKSHTLPSGYFDHVLRDAFLYIDSLYEEEI